MGTRNNLLTEFIEQFRAVGLKATYQRTEIMRELVVSGGHPDAETIYRRVRERIPTISLDTVYRTVRLLEEKGLISRVGLLRDRARFEANTERHHHFVCTECGAVHDFYSEALDGLELPEVSDVGDADCVYVEVLGRCRRCRGERG